MADKHVLLEEELEDEEVSIGNEDERERHEDILSVLDSKTNRVIHSYLEQDDLLQFIDRPQFWRSNMSILIFSFLGSIACLVTLLINNTLWIYLTMFPATMLIVLVGGFFYHRSKFYAFTKKGIIIHPSWGDAVAFKYDTLVSVDLQTNYLHCLQEIMLRRKMPTNPIPKQEFIFGLTNDRLLALKDFLESQIPNTEV